MRNVLLVSYPFPPSGTIGVARALAYLRYLRLYNCRITVLTALMPQSPVYDPALSSSIPIDVTVHRAWNPELPFAFRDRLWKHLMLTRGCRANEGESSSNRTRRRARAGVTWASEKIRFIAQYLLFPDPQNTWVFFAVRKAVRIIDSVNIDTVILNVPPFSTVKIGVELKRRYPALELITDFRDEWLGYYLNKIDDPTRQKRRRAAGLEREIIRASSYVSTVTPEWAHRLRSRYPDEPRAKFICTPNGYEPEMFHNFESRRRTDGKMLITYFGSVHMNQIYSPNNYLCAIEELPMKIRDQIVTRFIGRIRPDAERRLQQTTAIVEQLGFKSKMQGVHCLEETDFLLLIASDPTSHAGKLFDYLGTGKPIVALSPPDGAIAKVLRETRSGWCVDPFDQAAIQSMLLYVYELWKSGDHLIEPNGDIVREYSWPAIFAKFAAMTGIDQTTEDPAYGGHLRHPFETEV